MQLHHSTIPRVLSGFLLVLFAFSITPKKVLHDLVANHQDTHSKTGAGNTPVKILKAGFNCNTEDLVVESPFIENSCTIELTEPPALSLIFAERPVNFYYFHQIFAELRGPPAII